MTEARTTALRDILILGCGFTGKRVAARLLEQGHRVICTVRHAETLPCMARAGAWVEEVDTERPATLRNLEQVVPPEVLVLHSVPLVKTATGWEDPTPMLLSALRGKAARIVYLSTTGIYGEHLEVNEHTPADARTPRQLLRISAEDAVAGHGCSWLVLRPAAIYGPGRGVHVSMRQGRYRLPGNGSNYVSRIHADDLATQAIAALFSSITGTYPVADEHPCTSQEIAVFCARRLGIPPPAAAPPEAISETLRGSRRVDGSAIRKLLGVRLAYPSYCTGIPAAIAQEDMLAESGPPWE